MANLLGVCHFHKHIHIQQINGLFAFKYCALYLSCHFSNKLCFLAHTHVTICRSISTLDPVGNDSATVHYDFENPIYQAEDGSEEDCEVPGELARLLQEEKTIQPHEESIEIVNLGTEVDKKEVKIGAGLENSVKERLSRMLRDYVEVFAGKIKR